MSIPPHLPSVSVSGLRRKSQKYFLFPHKFFSLIPDIHDRLFQNLLFIGKFKKMVSLMIFVKS